MEKYSKAIAAGVGGALTGAGSGAVILPEGSPWYAYVLMALVTAVIPGLMTYLAKANAS